MLEKHADAKTTQPRAIPAQCDVVVIGGGPAGSAAATYLAQEGIDVVLLEKEQFPRPQVGESLIPHFWKFADRLGVSDQIKRENFVVKSGGIIAWKEKVYQLSFASFGYGDRPGLHVERDTFDDILLRHAVASGARVYEEVVVRKVIFRDGRRPVIAYADRRRDGFSRGEISCRYVIDASGYTAVLARQFNSRRVVTSDTKYLGLWGYYKDSLYLGGDRQSHPITAVHDTPPVTFISSFEDGWIWHIILRHRASVGLIINTDRIKGMGKADQEAYFRATCAQTPILQKLLEPAVFIEGSMGFRPDYSYYNDKVAGENFISIGDAAGFVDPIFSQGVQAALYNATMAAWAVKSSLARESQRARYFRMAANQISQFYSFARLMALGHFGQAGIDADKVKALMAGFPANELDLALVAAMTTDRSQYLHRIATDAGMAEKVDREFAGDRLLALDELEI